MVYMKSTGLSSQRIIQKNADDFEGSYFFDAFYYAYVNHGDVLLTPDEIWIMIGFYLSKYIDDNAEKLRKKLVKHEGFKKLTVKQGADSLE